MPPAVVMTVAVVVMPSAVCPAVTGGVAPRIETLLANMAAVELLNVIATVGDGPTPEEC